MPCQIAMIFEIPCGESGWRMAAEPLLRVDPERTDDGMLPHGGNAGSGRASRTSGMPMQMAALRDGRESPELRSLG